jgi:basic membrane lipoprotein Med (substrate-binding protein (PBP1-ABC) superfamily)
MFDRLAWMRRITRQRRWLLVAVAALVAAVGVAWAVWPSEPAPRARQYLDFTACLLTDEHGIAGPEATPVWAGMQEASLATRAKVQYVSVVGPQTADNAVPFLSSLAQGRCNLVFAVGAVPVGAVGKAAAQFPGTRFVVVGGAPADGNVSKVDVGSAEATRTSVKRFITTAVG